MSESVKISDRVGVVGQAGHGGCARNVCDSVSDRMWDRIWVGVWSRTWDHVSLVRPRVGWRISNRDTRFDTGHD